MGTERSERAPPRAGRARLLPACPPAGEARGAEPRGAEPRASRVSSRPLLAAALHRCSPAGPPGLRFGAPGSVPEGAGTRRPGAVTTWQRLSEHLADAEHGWRRGWPGRAARLGPRLCARPAAGGAFFPPPRAPCKRGESGSLPAAGGEPAPESLGCFFKLSVQASNRASKAGKVWTFGKGRVALGRGTAWAKASRWAGCRATKGGEARWEGPGLCIPSARGWAEAWRGTPLQQGGLLEKF